jgi:tetratricopeptide (TPR) repeat protein
MSARLLAIALSVITVSAAQQEGRPKRVIAVLPQEVQAFERQAKVALLVGVGDYPESGGLSRVRYAASDVTALATALDDDGYTVRSLINSEATRGAVRKALRDMAELVDKDQGTALFYFSGHGFAQDGVNYLAVYGTVADDLKGEGLPLAEVLELIGRVPARRKVLFMDACRNNPLVGREISSPRSFTTLSEGEGLRILYATRPGGLSYENDQLEHGVFSYFLLRGLRGEAAGKDGLITFSDLANYVTESVRTFGLQKGEAQIPFESGEAAGEFLLARLASTVTPAGERRSGASPSGDAAAKAGLELVAQQKYGEAVTAFSTAISAGGAVAEEYYYRGLSYGHLQEYQRAADDFTKSLELGGDAAEVYANRGYAYSALKEQDRAIQDFTRAIELKPDYAAAFVSRGRAYAAQSNHSRAISDFDKAIEVQPNLPAAYRGRGQSRAALQEYDQALRDLTKAIELEPGVASPYVDRGDLHTELGDTPAALADYTQAIERQPDYAPGFQRRARLYLETGDYSRALADCNQAIQRDPSAAAAYANRGYAHAALKQYQPAIEDCNRAIELQPNLAEAFNNRGYAYAGLKEFQRAIEDYSRAIELEPGYGTAYENRAAARRAVGDARGAKADSERAHALKIRQATVKV